MSARLDQLLAAWEDGTLSREGAQELKRWLTTREGRARLVQDWMLYENLYEVLRAESSQELQAAELQPISRPEPRRHRVWIGRWLIWREVSIPLRWALGGVAAACIIGLGIHQYWMQQSTAYISGRGETVFIQRGEDRFPARSGTALQPGDRVLVGPKSSAAIKWHQEATEVVLESNADMQFVRQATGKQLTLRAGRMRATVARQRAGRPMCITTPQAEVTVLGTKFSLAAGEDHSRLEVLEGAVGLRKTLASPDASPEHITVAAGEAVVAKPDEPLVTEPVTGCFSREIWCHARHGKAVTPYLVCDDFLTSFPVPAWPNPSIRDWKHTYTETLRGYITIPATGAYTFWVSSANFSELWLSPDSLPANRRRIAYVPVTPTQPGRTGRGSGRVTWKPGDTNRVGQMTLMREERDSQMKWKRFPSQKSEPIELTAGQRCYFEVKHLLTQSDCTMVAWSRRQQKKSTSMELLPASVLSPFINPKPISVAHNQR